MRSPNTFVVKPDWSSLKSSQGFLLGEEVFDRAEDMPVNLYPTQGIVVSTPDGSACKPGDTLFFTWNAVSFNRCISPIEEENLFALNIAWYAYMHDGELKTTDDFLLLSPIKKDMHVRESGFIVGAAQLVGAGDNVSVAHTGDDEELVGIVEVLPENQRCDVSVGDKVSILSNSDVRVKINGKWYYRTRLSELMYKHEQG